MNFTFKFNARAIGLCNFVWRNSWCKLVNNTPLKIKKKMDSLYECLTSILPNAKLDCGNQGIPSIKYARRTLIRDEGEVRIYVAIVYSGALCAVTAFFRNVENL